MRIKLALLTLLITLSPSIIAKQPVSTIYDQERERSIPFSLNLPNKKSNCTAKNQCPVAIINAGYGISHDKYQFISEQFNQLGYLTIAVGHELPTDPPLSVSGNLYETRSENWQRGANTLKFIRKYFSDSLPNYDFDNLTLIGHSNGGDISAWLANEKVDYINTMITLDHRRVPLPRNKEIKVFSIRASDFPADTGVLYTEEESKELPVCVTTIENAKHNDIHDDGPKWLKGKINLLITQFINQQDCKKVV